MTIPESVSYDWHGYWVEHVDGGAIGRIGYCNEEFDLVVVIWEGEVPVGLTPVTRRPIGYWVYMEDLTFLDREPTSWYDFEAIDRRLGYGPPEVVS